MKRILFVIFCTIFLCSCNKSSSIQLNIDKNNIINNYKEYQEKNEIEDNDILTMDNPFL